MPVITLKSTIQPGKAHNQAEIQLSRLHLQIFPIRTSAVKKRFHNRDMISGPGQAMFRGVCRGYPLGRTLPDVQRQWKLDIQAFFRIRYESLYSDMFLLSHISITIEITCFMYWNSFRIELLHFQFATMDLEIFVLLW